jgi:hypothetical protein
MLEDCMNSKPSYMPMAAPEGKCIKGGACKGTGWVEDTIEVPLPGDKKGTLPVSRPCPHCSGGSLEDILKSPAMETFFKE